MMDELKQRFAADRRTARRARRRAAYRSGLRPFAVGVVDVSKEHNVGSLVRTAHATAASELLLVGDREWNTEAARTAELYTQVVQLPDPETLLAHLTKRRWNLVAVELDPRAVSLFEARYPERPCFVLGAELHGLPEAVLEAATTVVEIPQWGLVPSLNVAVAGSIVIYDYLAKLHRRGALDRPRGGLVGDGPESPGHPRDPQAD